MLDLVASPGRELATISDATAALCSRRISSAELVADTLARIDRINPTLHAFNMVDHEGALAQARVLDGQLARGMALGPLHGLPVAIKDTVDVLGLPTTGSSRALDWRPAQRDAAVVARLRAAGAVIVGKANTWELGCGTGEIQSAAAFPDARNPVDGSRFAGGSSNGSAVAVAAGLVYAAIGGDTGGSIRSPASACGIVGLKPTHGAVPLDGFLAHSATLDHAGPMTRSVLDARSVLSVIGDIAFSTAPPSSLRGMRLGISPEINELDADVASAFDAVLARLHAAGANVTTIAIGRDLARWRETLGVIAGYESARQNAGLLRKPDCLSPSVREWLDGSARISDADYAAALVTREILNASLDSASAEVDALIMPSSFRSVPPANDETARVAYSLSSPNAVFNMSGYPAISIPNGRDREGLPTGLQIAMPRGSDLALLHLAALIEHQIQST
jgi:aspartyl-tRNA(Asn)/glutamyl-tRNA(Gln) amidotransferase subunit A